MKTLHQKHINAIFLFIIVMTILTLVVDFEKDQTGSLFYLFISLLNVLVMGILTFFIFQVNDKVANISKDSLRLTKYQIKNIEMREMNALIGIVDDYINQNKIVSYIALPHLSYSNKQIQLINSQMTGLDKELLKYNLTDFIDMRISTNTPLTKEQSDKYNYVQRMFDHLVPTAVKARFTLQDIIHSFENLQKFRGDNNFYRFILNSELPKHLIDILSIPLNKIIENNQDTDKVIPDLNINTYDADQIFNFTDQINSFLINLKGLILEEQQELINFLNEIDKTK
jgi:hypothetical protein